MFKYTCVNTDSSVLIKYLKKTPIRRRKKIIESHCSKAMRNKINIHFCSFVPPIKEQNASLEDVLHLLNKIFLINKNVKLNAYVIEETDFCCRC